jgi:phage shock protein A
VKKVVTENQLQDHLKNLQTQMVEAQTKTVMLQGAVQMVELQIQEMNDPSDKTPENKNGVN